MSDRQPYEAGSSATGAGPTDWSSRRLQRRIRQRYRRERIFHALGILAILLASAFLVSLILSITMTGKDGFIQTEVRLEVYFNSEFLPDTAGMSDGEAEAALMRADYSRILRESLFARFPEVSGRSDLRRLLGILSSGGRQTLRDLVVRDPGLIGTRQKIWLLTSDDIDQLAKGHIDRTLPESDRRVSDKEIAWFDQLREAGDSRISINWNFFTSGDSREPELAGILGAVVGSALTLIVTLLVAFPVGVGAAIYLEEFAPQNRWTDLIEVNINNLAAVPSIVFGLLGLAVLLGTFGLPRSAPLVGGLTLALMTLPTIIIASRSALKAVPPSIRDAARGLGASRNQIVFHHVVPLALPGILTGTIIGMAQALGETAPLLMIGMVAFIVDIPGGITDAATALPVQIFIWSDSPERAFLEKTSAAILVLLFFLIAMNATAIWLRNRFEKHW